MFPSQPSLPQVVKRRATADEANRFKAALESIGAQVELRPSSQGKGKGKERSRPAPLTNSPPTSIDLPPAAIERGPKLVSVWLMGFQRGRLEDAAAGLRNIFGITEQAANNIVESTPLVVKRRAKAAEGERYASALAAIGGEVEIRPAGKRKKNPAPLTNAPPIAMPSPASGPPPIAFPAPGGAAVDPFAPSAAAPPAAAAIALGEARPVAEAPREEPEPAPPEPDVPPREPKSRTRNNEICVTHRESDATFFCVECGLPWCDRCVEHRWEKTLYRDRCRRCGAVVDNFVGSKKIDGVGDYLDEIRDVVRLPFRHGVLFTLIGLAIITAPLNWAIGNNISGILAGLGATIVFGLEASIYFNILRQVAYGADEIHPPDFTDFISDIIAPLRNYLMALVPIIAALVWAAIAVHDDIFAFFFMDRKDITEAVGPTVLLAIGILLLPLLTIMAAMSASALSVLNPVGWVKGLRVVGAKYVPGALLFYALLCLETFVLVPMALKLTVIPVAGSLVGSLVLYCTMAIRAGVLGTLIVGRV
jgi:hypothetical protein